LIPPHIETPFKRMGARVKVRHARGRLPVFTFGLDIERDARGEHFSLLVPHGSRLEEYGIDVIDVRPDLRHLLLLVRQENRKDKFLCGHDERHWFTCAVPGPGVASVRTAMQALKPAEIRTLEDTLHLPGKHRLKRRNPAFVRQGEWFFVPAPDLNVPAGLIRRNEPISRGRGKPHRLEEAYRSGGEAVWVSHRHPTGVTQRQYEHLLDTHPKARSWGWRLMRRGASVYARGRVSHGDHATITLSGWHRVLMNTEHEAPAARNVVFLD